MTEAKGFCTCKRDAPDRPHLHPAPGATWHNLCDKPVLPCRTCGFHHPEQDCPRWEPMEAECDCSCCGMDKIVAHIAHCEACWPMFAALGKVFDGLQ